MSTDVVMPQMGESIAEGTITKWLKKVGESVERDEPLFEISTDKVDAEIPSPAAGTLTEIRFKEGDTVEVNTVVAVLDGDGASPSAKSASQPARFGLADLCLFLSDVDIFMIPGLSDEKQAARSCCRKRCRLPVRLRASATTRPTRSLRRSHEGRLL